jgi:hypothetical protein
MFYLRASRYYTPFRQRGVRMAFSHRLRSSSVSLAADRIYTTRSLV